MTVVAQVQPRAVRATLKHRKSIDKLSADEVRRLRDAIKASLATSDNRGYQFYAGWHGVPFDWCWHHDIRFLPWHRAYLYFFELSLQRFDPTVTLPWWDWATDNNIPASYRTGALGSAPIKPFTNVTRAGWPKRTWREPGQSGMPPPPYGAYLDAALAAPSFTAFNTMITQIHDGVHVWVGGSMSDPAWAAYDPLFWAHHCMVDRAWRIWQHHHPGASSAEHPRRGDEAAQHQGARAARCEAVGLRLCGHQFDGGDALMQRWSSKPLSFEYDLKAPFKRADLELIGVEQRALFYAHIYLNNQRVADDAAGTRRAMRPRLPSSGTARIAGAMRAIARSIRR